VNYEHSMDAIHREAERHEVLVHHALTPYAYSSTRPCLDALVGQFPFRMMNTRRDTAAVVKNRNAS
jgi:hypothetical protein